MTLAHPIGIRLQNLWGSWVYAAVFVAVTLLSRAIVGVLLAFVVASVGSFLYRRYVNRLLPVPRMTAVLVTGCSSGVGQDAALRLSSIGFLVFATVRKQDDADKLKKKAERSSQLFPLVCDITKSADIAAAVETVKQRLAQEDKKLLGVICNAGYSETCPVEVASLETFRSVYETNVIGTVATAQAFLPLLREFAASSSHWARLVLLSSVAGRFSPPANGPYCSSKHAVEAIGDSLRMELHKWKIAVSIIEPGAIASSFRSGAVASRSWRLAEATSRLERSQLPAGRAVLEYYIAASAKTEAGYAGVPHESPACTSDALQCALLDSQPLSRYMAGWTSLAMFLVVNLPTELADLALGRDWR